MQSESVEVVDISTITSNSTSAADHKEKRWVKDPTRWLLTALLIANIVFATVGYVAIRNLQNVVADVQEDLSACSEVMNQMSGMSSENAYAADREKRSDLSPSSLSRLGDLGDVGSISAIDIKSMC